MTPQKFIAKWGPGGPSYALNERQGAQPHFIDLCRLLDVPLPGSSEDYIFEQGTLILGAARGYADVFMRDHFAWENKAPGRNLDVALKQLLGYSLALYNPPLLVVSDRLTIRIHTQFNGHPSEVHSVLLHELDRPEKQALLRRLWIDPESFRPKKTSRDITNAAAKSFATMADSLRKQGPTREVNPESWQAHADVVAHFLTQCLFCFFAEDVGLLPGRMFEELLKKAPSHDRLIDGLTNLFEKMRTGGLYGNDDIPWFNGGLFKTINVPKLSIMEMTELRNAAALNWSAIDVSIFGTLFERGLDPSKRSQLGAHYTDPATIMRIVDPVVVRPLTKQWDQEREGIRLLMEMSTKRNDRHHKAAHKKFVLWLEHLKNYRVLDPACGSGNFLFLGLKVLKDIEHKSHLEAAALGLDREADLVTGPQNVLGIELNEYAAELARVTIWIGELQWRIEHGYEFKTNPVLEPLNQIECRDALLLWDNGVPVEASWPVATVVIGNPPFLGGKKFISELGEKNAQALRSVYAGRIPGLADLVSYWFEKARGQMLSDKLLAAGLVTTNSLRDGFGHEVLSRLNVDTPIFEAWSDEAWINEGADVRVSLISFSPHVSYRRLDGVEVGEIGADLRPLAMGGSDDISLAQPMSGNEKVAFQGTTRSGPFDIPGQIARGWLALPNPNGKSNADVVRPWSNGLDVTRRPSDTWIVDFGVSMQESEASLYEKPFEYCRSNVKPTRVANRNPRLVEQWWHYDGVRVGMRKALSPLFRYIATTVTAKHRIFVWFHKSKLSDATLVVFAREDDATFGILQSRFHTLWSLLLGSTLENRPRYLPGACFETFPFPKDLTPANTAHQTTETINGGALIPANLANSVVRQHAIAIARAAKSLNDLRERWLNPPEWTDRIPDVIPLGTNISLYPDRILSKLGHEEEMAERTLTKLYNQRPAWLDAAHKALDSAVADAYNWKDYTSEMTDDEIFKRLLKLNQQRCS